MPINQYNSSVRQMSQSKFNSMKNSSGKIPDLANQIVMTNSEDTNISCLRTEVVYDMTSSDASKNWGYTNGIQGGVTVSGKDFSKYDKLMFYGYRTGIMTFCAEIDITIPTKSLNLFGRATNCFHFIAENVSYTAGMTIELNTSLTGFTAKFNQNTVDKNSDAEWFVAKIYGILKTPSMIYTGDELIAGNGISIENGEVKVNQNVLNSIDNKETIAGLNAVDISNTSFSSLRDCLSYLASDLTKTYYCYIGDAESCSFKNFVGNPTGFANYTLCLIKPIGKLTNQNVGIYTGSVYQCIAVGTIINKLAIGYIFNGENAINETTFSGWKVLF